MLHADGRELSIERTDQVELLIELTHVRDPVEQEISHRVRAKSEKHSAHTSEASTATPHAACRLIQLKVLKSWRCAHSGGRH